MPVLFGPTKLLLYINISECYLILDLSLLGNITEGYLISDLSLLGNITEGYLILDLSLAKIFTEPTLKAGPVQSEISTGIFIHISVYLITKFKIFICTKLEKPIT